MALERLIRIDLGVYSDEWNGGYMKLRTKGPQEALKLSKEVAAIQRKQERKSRRVERVQNEIKELLASDNYSDEQLDELEKREDKYTEDETELAQKTVDLMVNYVKDRLVEGKLNDVEITKDDIAGLDVKVISDIIAQVSGDISKKNM